MLLTKSLLGHSPVEWLPQSKPEAYLPKCEIEISLHKSRGTTERS
jgi:hypothetical protein